MATVVFGDFEWDDRTAAVNRRKHGVSFEEAVTVMIDPRAIEAPTLRTRSFGSQLDVRRCVAFFSSCIRKSSAFDESAS